MQSDTVIESVALKAATVMPALLLQHPHVQSKTKEDTRCFERFLLWSDTKIQDLLAEVREIQLHL